MIEKKEENIRSESYYPDSSYYLDQDNSQTSTFRWKDIQYGGNLNGQIAIGLLGKNKWASNDRLYGCHY